MKGVEKSFLENTYNVSCRLEVKCQITIDEPLLYLCPQRVVSQDSTELPFFALMYFLNV